MDKKEFIFPGVILGVVIIIAVALVITHSQKPALIPNTLIATSTATSTQPASTPAPSGSGTAASGPQAYYPYGNVTLSLNQAAGFKDGLSIRPTAIIEDSRCPMGVMCIQAGTVRVSLKVHAGGAEGVQTIALGDSISAGGDTIAFVSVEPVRMKEGAPANSAYRLTFTVTHASSPVAAGRCYTGGCSGEVCSDSPGAISSCIYRSEYACYKQATCERQASGSCGWTQTDELKACLAHPPALQ